MSSNLSNIPPVLQTMVSYSKAELLKVKDVNKHISMALWVNQNDIVEYHNNKHHTLSLYIKGGYNNFRLDKTTTNISGENKLCLMPKGERFSWAIGEPFQLGHFYFSDEYLKQTALETFDKDPRDIFLQELTFANDQALASLMRYGIFENDWNNPQNQHYMDHAIQMILLKLLQNNLEYGFTLPKVRGGLSAKNKALIKDYIHSHFTENLPLSQMARMLDLSEYHFAHMFKLSFANSPHQYIQALRVEKAAQQILTGASLINVALDCGFSSQSHLGRIFKQFKGQTPHKYKMAHR